MNDQPAPVPTVRALFDWYIANCPASRSRVALTERKRIMELFCAYRGARGDEIPYGDRLCAAFRPFHVLEFIKAQPSLKSAWTRKRWGISISVPFSDESGPALLRPPQEGA